MNERAEKTTTLPRSESTAREPMPVRLLALSGEDRGRELVFERGTRLIGSSSSCDWVLSDPTVSRRHATVEQKGGTVLFTDLESKNGLRYLGARVSQAEVKVGTSVELGAVQVAILPAGAPVSISEKTELAGLHGRSIGMRRLFAELERAAGSELPVLIIGETGTGKDAVARALHQLSSRAPGPFRIFDGTATGKEVVQSALFGHVRGAFTGADADVTGALDEANGGTLFLDEIGDLPLETQAILLRAVETKTFNRVGEGRSRSSDFRIVAATNRDLPSLVSRGQFRQDLYFRLAGVELRVPPLRERIEDIPVLAETFAREVGGDIRLDPSSVARFSVYSWPGNVRELRNAVQRLVVVGAGSNAAEIPSQGADEDYYRSRDEAMAIFEKAYLQTLVEKHGTGTEGAKRAGVTRSYLYKLLVKHGIVKKRE